MSEVISEVVATGMFDGRIPWRIYTDGRLQFHKKEDDGAGWSCYPLQHLDSFFVALKKKMDGGWWTPWDAQEMACRHYLATYSRPPYRQSKNEQESL